MLSRTIKVHGILEVRETYGNALESTTKGRPTWTKGKGLWKVIYYEACLNEQDARSRGMYLKSRMGKRYLKSRLKRFLSLMG